MNSLTLSNVKNCVLEEMTDCRRQNEENKGDNAPGNAHTERANREVAGEHLL